MSDDELEDLKQLAKTSADAVEGLQVTIGHLLIMHEAQKTLTVQLMFALKMNEEEITRRFEDAAKRARKKIVLKIGDKAPSLADSIAKIDWTESENG